MSRFLDAAMLTRHRRDNLLASSALLAAMAVILGVAGFALAGLPGVVIVSALLLALAVYGPRVAPETVMKLYQARPVHGDDGQLPSLVDVLAYRAELPVRPALYVIPSMTLNAFAAGSPNAPVIAITEGLLRRLTLREIAGVLAHEMSHIRNNDLAVMGLADAVTRLLQLLSYVALGLAAVNLVAEITGRETMSWAAIALLYIAPAISSFVQLGLSRTREFDADLEAAALTGDAMGLASALRQLDSETGHFWEDLSYPVPARRVPVPSLLRTHPSAEDRVNRLLSIRRPPGFDPIVIVEQPMLSLVGAGPASLKPRYRWPGLWF